MVIFMMIYIYLLYILFLRNYYFGINYIIFLKYVKNNLYDSISFREE